MYGKEKANTPFPLLFGSRGGAHIYARGRDKKIQTGAVIIVKTSIIYNSHKKKKKSKKDPQPITISRVCSAIYIYIYIRAGIV